VFCYPKAVEEDFLGFLGYRKAIEEDFLGFLGNRKAIEPLKKIKF
jgi:hypothetical protein